MTSGYMPEDKPLKKYLELFQREPIQLSFFFDSMYDT